MKSQPSLFRLNFFTIAVLFSILCLYQCGGGQGISFTNPTDNNNSGGSGSSDSDSDSDADADAACSDDGSTVSTTNLTAEVSGEPCNTPSPSTAETGVILLDCGTPSPGRTTTDNEADFTTITCGTGGGADIAAYFCTDGVIFKDDGATTEELFETVEINCALDDNGNGTIIEGELIIG